MDLRPIEFLFDTVKGIVADFSAGPQGGQGTALRQDGMVLHPQWGRASYLFNATIAGIEAADALLIIGANPRREAAVLNARIRKRWRIGNFPIGLIGEKADLTYNYDYLGAGPETLAEVLAGRHGFADTLKKAERPLVLVGAGALARSDGAAVAALAAKTAIEVGAVKSDWNGFSLLHNTASRVGALDLGFGPGAGGLTATADTSVGSAPTHFGASAPRVTQVADRLELSARLVARPDGCAADTIFSDGFDP